MSEALVLAGLELQVGAEPLAIVPAGSPLPPSAIMHLTRATLVCEAGAIPNNTQFLVIAQPSEDQEVVITSLSSPHCLSSALELVFHADSSPTFLVRSIPVLKDSSKYTIHLSGYVEVQEEADEEELDEEEIKELLAQRKKLGLDEDEDEDEDDDDELGDEEEGEEGEEEEDEEEQEGASAATQKATSASTPGKGAGTKHQVALKQSAGKSPFPAQTAESLKRKRQTNEDNEEEEEDQDQQGDEADAVAKPVNGHTSSSKKTPGKKQHSGTDTGSATKSSTTASTTTPTTPTVKRFPSGLEYSDETIGSGQSASNGRSISIRYRGELSSGQVFDSNMPKGQPFSFKLGAGECIKGFDLGIVGMKVGGKRVITIPAALGYGKKGSPPKIPPNSTLKFTVELLKA